MIIQNPSKKEKIEKEIHKFILSLFDEELEFLFTDEDLRWDLIGHAADCPNGNCTAKIKSIHPWYKTHTEQKTPSKSSKKEFEELRKKAKRMFCKMRVEDPSFGETTEIKDLHNLYLGL